MKVAILFVLFIASSNAALSFCDKYSQMLNLTNKDLVTYVVGTTFGLLVNDSLSPNLRVFFDGSGPGGDTDFIGTDEGSTLALHLVEFFAMPGALGCTDKTIGAYEGDKDMRRVHAGMPITNRVFNAFNSRLAGVLQGAGVSTEDLTSAGALLESFRHDICNQPDCGNEPLSFCDYYSLALNLTNLDLVTYVVSETFGLLVNATLKPDLRGFFNGSGQGGSKTNFIGTDDGSDLALHLIEFFAMPGALNCTDASIPPYEDETDMKKVHAKMAINNATFVAFNSRLASVLKGAGVADKDLAAAGALLESFRPAICNQPDCGNPTSTSTSTSAAAGTSTTGAKASTSTSAAAGTSTSAAAGTSSSTAKASTSTSAGKTTAKASFSSVIAPIVSLIAVVAAAAL